jgi:hypothetical protein
MLQSKQFKRTGRWVIDAFDAFATAGEDEIFSGLLQHGIEIIILSITYG